MFLAGFLFLQLSTNIVLWGQLHGPVWPFVIYSLAGFIPVYLTAKVAPYRQLLIAIECALLVVSSLIFLTVAVVAVLQRDGSEYRTASIALAIGQRLASLGACAYAVWLVKKQRATEPERGSKWVWATGFLLPVAALAAIVLDTYLS